MVVLISLAYLVQKNQKLINIILYQLGFTAVLTFYFGIVLTFYLASLDNFSPRIRFRKTQPALAVRPLTPNPYTALIEFTSGYSGDWKPLTASINNFLSSYSHGKYPGSSLKCNRLNLPINESVYSKDNWCHVSRRRLVDFTHGVHCSKNDDWGYALAEPCILLKPTKTFDWEPEPYYNVSEVNQLKDMPKWLKTRIESTWNKHCKGKGLDIESKCPKLRMVWVSCAGETLADTEYMGIINYTPRPGYPGYYFPYLNQNHYLSPLVSIQFRDLTPGVLVSVVCKLWAKNIQHDKFNPYVGGVRIELRMN